MCGCSVLSWGGGDTLSHAIRLLFWESSGRQAAFPAAVSRGDYAALPSLLPRPWWGCRRTRWPQNGEGSEALRPVPRLYCCEDFQERLKQQQQTSKNNATLGLSGIFINFLKLTSERAQHSWGYFKLHSPLCREAPRN